jgi:hypothetical protein
VEADHKRSRSHAVTDAAAFGPPDIISYSFDMLLPIIRLRESHYQFDLKTWARDAFLRA